VFVWPSAILYIYYNKSRAYYVRIIDTMVCARYNLTPVRRLLKRRVAWLRNNNVPLLLLLSRSLEGRNFALITSTTIVFYVGQATFVAPLFGLISLDVFDIMINERALKNT